MIIEFTGIPGSGKTTAARAQAEAEGFEYIETVGPYEKYIYFLYYVLRHPILYTQLKTQTFVEGVRTGSFKLLCWKIWMMLSAVARTGKALSHSKNKTVILDEGLAQYGMGLFERKINEAQASRYVKRFLVSSKIIFLETVELEAIERLKNRGNIPRAGMLADWNNWFGQYVQNSQIFKQVYEKNKIL